MKPPKTHIHMNTIVKEIHSSFDVAEEELLNEANRILENARDEDNKMRAEHLSRMGFGNAKPVRMLSKEEQNRAKDLLFLKKRYTRIAPQYKFITGQKLMSICKKYGLVLGSSERYVEDIPEQNQEDIRNFKILDKGFLEVSDDTYQNAKHKTGDGAEMHPKDMSTSHMDNLLSYYRRKFKDREQYGQYMSSIDVGNLDVDLIRSLVTELHLRGEEDLLREQRELWRHTPLSTRVLSELFTPLKTTYFYVAADIDSFNTEGTTLEDNKLVEQNNNKELEESMKQDLFRHYDPIVLAKVQGGYLIVTAWGDEASDPDVVEPTRN